MSDPMEPHLEFSASQDVADEAMSEAVYYGRAALDAGRVSDAELGFLARGFRDGYVAARSPSEADDDRS